MDPTVPRQHAYAQRFESVLAHIDTHLDDDLSIEVLSRIAHFSKYHFHRQFSAYVGTGVLRYVQLMRLRRASRCLISAPDVRILNVALDAGFDSPEAFARAFRRAFGQSPSEFRRRPRWDIWSACFVFPHFERSFAMQVQIVDFPETRVAALEHRGQVGHLNNTLQSFIDWRKQTGLSPVQSSRTFGIPYGNPDTTPPDDFRFDICGEVNALVPSNPQGVRELVIPAGRCAVVRHSGSTDCIGETIYPLYRDWLPSSGEELRDFPIFFHYLSVFPETPQDAWQTDIYLPLK